MPGQAVRCAVGLLLAAGMGAAGGWAQTPIRVYVQAGSGDFAANGAGDSALDLRKALLGKSRTLRVVDQAAEADLVVRLDSRNVRKETASVNTYENKSSDGKSATATTVPTIQNVDVLHATIVAGNSEIPLETESALSWRLAASDMASSVDHWVKENYAKLIERRLQPGTGPRTAAGEPVGAGAAGTGGQATEETSITPGMSEAEVLKAMGAPEKKVSFGHKSLWSYRGMQVVFEDGKVSDVKF